MVADSQGDIRRGYPAIRPCGIPLCLKGEYTEGAGPGIDVYSMRQPLGVGGRHHAVQLPGDVDVWRRHHGGNTFVLKPSERDPSVPVRLGELFIEAGQAAGLDVTGVLNVVHGDKVAVDAILTRRCGR